MSGIILEHPVAPTGSTTVPLADLPPLVTTEQVRPPTVTSAERRPGWSAVALLSAAGLVFGLAGGLATGLLVANGRIHELETQIAAATVTDAEISLAREHLAQVPGGWVGDTYSLAREHLAQVPGGWATDAYSLPREHLAQAPTA